MKGYKNAHTEVFMNPDIKEVRELGSPDVRFIIDFEHKRLYVWNAHNALHKDVSHRLHLSEDNLGGEGSYHHNRFEIKHTDIDNLLDRHDAVSQANAQHFRDQDWSWLRYYIKYEDYLQSLDKLMKEHPMR